MATKRVQKKNIETTEPARPNKRVVKKAVKIAIDPFAEVATAKSPSRKRAVEKTKAPVKRKKKEAVAVIEAPTEEIVKTVSPAFEALADVRLPELARENRARLQMQSPTRVHLYWSLKENPWAILRNVFGASPGSYTLVVKLIDATHGVEEIHQCEAEGDWWFDVDANTEYRAEIGFYAPNRPYFRVIYSNSILMPRRAPSTRPATESQWRVSADKFAEVLDVAGFSRDAFDVAMAGDDYAATEDVTRTAFFSLIKSDDRIEAVPVEDIRYAMLSLASGVAIAELHGRVSRKLYEILMANTERLTPGRTRESLAEHFDIDETDFSEEVIGSAVFGASVVNFPRTLKTRWTVPKQSLRPFSSHSLR